MSRETHSLKSFNTFGIDASAQQITIAETVAELSDAWEASQKAQLPFLLLGEGSNVLFLENYAGVVVVNRLKGIKVTEDDEAWYLHVGAGENWHELVEYSLKNGFSGLENLALIPGCVGSAPIQNIGAYGVELNQVCDYVDVLNLRSGEIEHIGAAECQFGYRDSVFKHHYRDGYAIVAVGLRLNKVWQPVMTYGELTKLDPAKVTPQEIFDGVCQMRRSKLPDPQVTGNAGSFFKNPVVDAEQAATIASEFPTMPQYLQANGQVKLAAGWLIDQCALKGHSNGGAAVHRQQALVIINQQNATGRDIVLLAHEIRQRVGEKFNVWLEPEVRFMGATGEKDAVEVIA
ncbi:UDP-N-acetylmuramate dehydrogenase [Erwiniaceae bacterium BAC15a-03b]|uniref:UDP-N-acetylenolpyruvoylglucosamine reductase n=1 Tax=Winslowiella arboricola TaxID=2978220 RepID=A0A9J6PCK3_9GAMM|nr:UDP-N-acetylmuramate dehydrogenase [Winslowiella arboricola]MCU5771615.1 UDP-N-acetylmuramate dehydrogenase [Winslowiella arboricola]MCU5775913.1 UDP-N-acetylmuramate dehydrogenase [Winslowiella arboricola]